MAKPSGTQVISRASALLRLVSGEAAGIGTAEVARRAELTRPTAHRLLTALADEGLLDRDSSGLWFAGPELYVMGSLAAGRYDIGDIARDAVAQLAAETGESAFFSARRGDETVCLLREEGSFPIRSFVLYEGVRFPLGVASAGLAILSFMKDSDVDAYFRRQAAFDERHSEQAVRARIAQTRARGYAVNPGLIVEGSWGMGAAVFDQRGEPAWALSLTGVEFRFGADRQPELGALLLHHAHEVSKRLAER